MVTNNHRFQKRNCKGYGSVKDGKEAEEWGGSSGPTLSQFQGCSGEIGFIIRESFLANDVLKSIISVAPATGNSLLNRSPASFTAGFVCRSLAPAWPRDFGQRSLRRRNCVAVYIIRGRKSNAGEIIHPWIRGETLPKFVGGRDRI